MPIIIVETRLDWLIARSCMDGCPPHRRLWALRNLMYDLARSPCAMSKIDPTRELTMSPETRVDAVAWISQTGEVPPDADVWLTFPSANQFENPEEIRRGWVRIAL